MSGLYDISVSAEALKAAAAWATAGEDMAAVELLADDRMLLVTQADDRAGFDTGGEPASDEYLAVAPLDRETGRGGQTMTAAPFESDQDVLASPEVRAIIDQGRYRAGSLDLITAALAGSGVELSGYENRTLRWLGCYDLTSVAVIAGWIRRAHEAGKAARPCQE